MLTTFEVESVTPLCKLSDQISPRQIAKERIKKYRQKQISTERELPPEVSIRRVYFAASKDSRRTIFQKIRSRVQGFLERLIR